MCSFFFSDGGDICRYSNGKIVRYKSKFIEKYKENALNSERSKSWKHSGEGAKFRGDVRPGEDAVNFDCKISGIYPVLDDIALYSFKINEISGIYRAETENDKAQEVHIYNSIEYEFFGGCLDTCADILVCAAGRNSYNSDIAVFDISSGDFKTVTEGDTLDCDPFVSPENGNIIYFTSRGAGRDESGSFVKYSNASICKLDLSGLTVDEIAVSDKVSYMKPMTFGGKLYAIAVPAKEKKSNPIIEILLIPFRIIQAIINFINIFVTAFTGKSLASGGSNPAKGREYDSRKEFIKGNFINYEKELKKNAKKKDKDYGLVPMSWKLVDVESGEVIKSGVADYDIASDGTFIVTNGRRIFAINNGMAKKLCNAENCLTVACVHKSLTKTELFE